MRVNKGVRRMITKSSSPVRISLDKQSNLQRRSKSSTEEEEEEKEEEAKEEEVKKKREKN